MYNIAGREAWDKKILRDGVGAIFTVKGVPMGDRGTTPVVISTKTIDELQLYSENNSQVIEVNELNRGIQSMIGQSVDFWPNYDATYLLTTYPENQLLAFTDVKDINTGIVGGANHDMDIDKAKFDRGDLGYRLKFEEVDPSIPNLYYLNGEIGKDKFFPLNPSISPYIESHHFNKNAGHGGVADRMSFLKGYVMYMDVLARTRDFQVEIGFIKQNQLRVFSFEAAVDANQKMIGYYIKVWENKAAYLNNNSPYYLVRPYGYYSNYRQDKYAQYPGALTDLGPYSAILKKLYPSDGLSYLFLTDASLEIYNQTFDLNGFQGKFYQAFEKAIVRPVLGVKLKYTSVSAVTADVPVTSSPKVAKTFTTIVNNCSNAKLTHFIGDARKVSNSTITTRQTTRGEGTFNSYEHEVYGSLSYSKGFGIPGAGAGFTVRVTSGWNKKHSELTTTDSGFATDTFSIDDNGISKTRTMYISPWNSIVVKEVSAEYQNITLYGAKIERVEGNFPSGRKLTGVELLAQLKQDGRVGTVDRVGADYVEYTEPFSIHIDRLNETFINVEEKATCIVP